MEKKTVQEKEKYQPSYDTTILSEARMFKYFWFDLTLIYMDTASHWKNDVFWLPIVKIANDCRQWLMYTDSKGLLK